jgi:hypothetical protein
MVLTFIFLYLFAQGQEFLSIILPISLHDFQTDDLDTLKVHT